MRINVPFIPQTANMNCGPAALRMVFSFFDKDYAMPELENACGLENGKACGTIQMAIAAAKLGFKAELYSTSLEFNKDNLEEEFYKEYGGEDLMEQSLQFFEDARELGVVFKEISITLDELFMLVSPESVPIVLVDWNVISGKGGIYQGHFLSVVGYDEKYVYVHNSGPQDAREFLPIEKEIFDKARKAKGTDEDILVIRQ